MEQQNDFAELTLENATKWSRNWRKLKEEKEKLSAVFDDEIAYHEALIAEIKARKEEAVKPIEGTMDWYEAQMVAFHRKQRELDEKNNKTVKLPYCNLVSRKSAAGFTKNDADLLAWAKASAAEYVDVKTTESVNWAELKKKLIVVNGKVLYEGEELDCVVPKAEEIKYTIE